MSDSSCPHPDAFGIIYSTFYIHGGRSGQKNHFISMPHVYMSIAKINATSLLLISSIPRSKPHIISPESKLSNIQPSSTHIFTSPGTSTSKTLTPFFTSSLPGILSLRISSAHLVITGSFPIVATATTSSPLK